MAKCVSYVVFFKSPPQCQWYFLCPWFGQVQTAETARPAKNNAEGYVQEEEKYINSNSFSYLLKTLFEEV